MRTARKAGKERNVERHNSPIVAKARRSIKMSDNDQVSDETVVEPVAVAEETTPPADDTVNSEDDKNQPEVKPEKTFTQKELDDILTRRLAKEQRKIERYAKAEAENGYLREQLASRQPQQSDDQGGEPKPEQFKTYEEYLDKLTDWKVDKKLADMQEKSVRQRQEESQQSYESKARDNLMKASEKYDDFEEVVTNPKMTVTVPMRDALGESELGGEIAYYLGNNLKEADAIAQMSPVQQVKAIDKLEQKLKGTPQVTKAPAPMSTTGKGRATTEPDLSKMSVSEYAEYRAKNGARWARH